MTRRKVYAREIRFTLYAIRSTLCPSLVLWHIAKMTDKRIVLTTAGSKDEAERIAADLVQRSHAACVNVAGPISSTYRWKGKVEHAQEFLLIIKTTTHAIGHVRAAIEELHSYELPEFVVLPIEAGSERYLEWIAQCVS